MFIYVIVCTETLKIYVGQHKGENLQKYLQTKFSNAQRNSGIRSHLFRAMQKHSKGSWSIYPLVSGIETRQELDDLERYYIRVLKCQHPDVGYNICDGGEGFTGRHSDEARQKMRMKVQAYYDAGGVAGATGTKHTDEWKQQASIRAKQYKPTEETKQQIAATLQGHSVSEETRQKMAEARRGKYVGSANQFFGKHHSEETKRKNAEAHRKPWSAARRAAFEAKRLS